MSLRLTTLPTPLLRRFHPAATLRCTFHSSTISSLKKTALHEFHIANSGKMVEYAGYSMPVQYPSGLVKEHAAVRTAVGVFDVGHMLQLEVKGADRTSFLESLVVADLVSLPENSSTLSVFTTKSGGVLDDTVINKRSDDFYVVANAGCAEKDLKHLRNYEAEWKSQGKDVEIKVLEKALVAVQGPGAVGVLKALADDADALSNMGFMTSREMKLNGMRVYLTRCGYTGEDGYEIQVSNSDATKLVDKILSTPLPAGIASSSGFTKPVLAGLGARDSLRLEAGLCLYGHELSETINPIEAGLTWTIGARRRLDSDETKFLGSETVLSVLRSKKPAQRRVGLIVEGAPARDGAEIYSLTNSATPIGTVTSGCPSPTLKKNIAMGYVTSGYHAKDTELFVKVRGKLQRAKVVKLPFVPHNYFRG